MGIAALRCVVEWQPVAAHAGVRTVTAFLECPSAAGAPFIRDFDRWREGGIRLFTLYGAGGAGSKLASELAAGRIADFVGGSPRKAAVLVGGVEGARGTGCTRSGASFPVLTRSHPRGFLQRHAENWRAPSSLCSPNNPSRSLPPLPSRRLLCCPLTAGDARAKLSKSLQDAGVQPENIFFIDLL